MRQTLGRTLSNERSRNAGQCAKNMPSPLLQTLQLPSQLMNPIQNASLQMRFNGLMSGAAGS